MLIRKEVDLKSIEFQYSTPDLSRQLLHIVDKNIPDFLSTIIKNDYHLISEGKMFMVVAYRASTNTIFFVAKGLVDGANIVLRLKMKENFV